MTRLCKFEDSFLISFDAMKGSNGKANAGVFCFRPSKFCRHSCKALPEPWSEPWLYLIDQLSNPMDRMPPLLYSLKPPFLNHRRWFKIISWGSFWDRSGIVLGPSWDHFGSFCDHFGLVLGSFWVPSGIILGSFWDHFGSFWCRFFGNSGIILRSFWNHFGIILGS